MRPTSAHRPLLNLICGSWLYNGLISVVSLSCVWSHVFGIQYDSMEYGVKPCVLCSYIAHSIIQSRQTCLSQILYRFSSNTETAMFNSSRSHLRCTSIYITYIYTYIYNKCNTMPCGHVMCIYITLMSLPNVPIFMCPKMGLRAPESKKWDRFYKPNIPQKWWNCLWF